MQQDSIKRGTFKVANTYGYTSGSSTVSLSACNASWQPLTPHQDVDALLVAGVSCTTAVGASKGSIVSELAVAAGAATGSLTLPSRPRRLRHRGALCAWRSAPRTTPVAPDSGAAASADGAAAAATGVPSAGRAATSAEAAATKASRSISLNVQRPVPLCVARPHRGQEGARARPCRSTRCACAARDTPAKTRFQKDMHVHSDWHCAP